MANQNSIQTIIQFQKVGNIEFSCIQFNKIFIQLENSGIAHPYDICVIYM